jgi:hypothetical protein
MNSPPAQPWLAVALKRRSRDLASRSRPMPGEEQQGGCYRPRALNYGMGGGP